MEHVGRMMSRPGCNKSFIDNSQRDGTSYAAACFCFYPFLRPMNQFQSVRVRVQKNGEMINKSQFVVPFINVIFLPLLLLLTFFPGTVVFYEQPDLLVELLTFRVIDCVYRSILVYL